MQGSNTSRQAHAIDVAQLMVLVAEVRDRTAHAIDELVGNLEAACRSDGEVDFAGLLKVSQQLLQMDDLEMSRMLKVARPTIGRWIRGVSAPHALGRAAIFDVLVKKARSRARELRS